MTDMSIRRNWALCLIAALGGCSVQTQPIGVGYDPSIEPAAGPVSLAGASRLEWPKSSSCPALLDEVARLHQFGQLGAMSGTAPIALLIDDPNLSLIGDVSLPITSQSQAAVFDCLIVIGEAQMAPAQPRQVLADRKLRSAYPAGIKRLANPDYIEPANGNQSSGTGLGGINSTGDPTLDLVGVIAESVLIGIDALFTEDALVSSNQGAVQARYVDEPRLFPYSYQMAEIEASRSARVPIALIDQRRGERVETNLALRETQLFALSDDRHPDDPQVQHDPSARLISTLQLRRWEASPPSLSMAGLIEHLQVNGSAHTKPAAKGVYQPRKLFGASEASAHPVQLVPTVIEPAAGTITGVDLEAEADKIELAPIPAATGVVRIQAEDQEFAGFFVSNDHLIVPFQAITPGALVELMFPDGVKVLGLVEKRDPALGLALIFSPRADTPMKLSSVPAEVTERSNSLSGQPLLRNNAVAGLWISDDVKGWRFIASDVVREFAAFPGVATVSR